ncbi:MAG: hypothetical protein ACLFTC_07985, partial [Desulfonatronovibrio sp.]
PETCISNKFEDTSFTDSGEYISFSMKRGLLCLHTCLVKALLYGPANLTPQAAYFIDQAK